MRDQKRHRLTGRDLWLTLGPDGRLLVRTALSCAIIVLLAFCSVRVLFGGSTTSWNQRLTVIVDTPAGESRGVRSTTRGEAVALEVLPGRWLFALLSGDDDGKGTQASRSTTPFDWERGASSAPEATDRICTTCACSHGTRPRKSRQGIPAAGDL